MLIFNANALIAVGLGIAAGFLLGIFIPAKIIAVFAGILIAMAIDVWMRFRSEDCEYPLVNPNAGGHVWFAPVWLLGIIAMVLMGLSKLGIV